MSKKFYAACNIDAEHVLIFDRRADRDAWVADPLQGCTRAALTESEAFSLIGEALYDPACYETPDPDIDPDANYVEVASEFYIPRDFREYLDGRTQTIAQMLHALSTI